MIRRHMTGWLLLSTLSLVGCRSAPAEHYYVVVQAEVAPVAGSTRSTGLRLGIAPFSVDSPYDEDQLVYRVGRDSPEVAFYSHHRWAAPLQDQLQLAAATAFLDLPGVASTGPLGIDRDYDAVLLGRLLYLEELDVPEEQIARIGIELILINRHNQQIWSQAVSAHVGGQAADVPTIVRQMSRALQEALGKARPGLNAAIAKLENR